MESTVQMSNDALCVRGTLSNFLEGQMAEEINWDETVSFIRHKLEMALARHPKVGQAMTFGEGEKLISDLSASLTYDIRRHVDPTYDT